MKIGVKTFDNPEFLKHFEKDVDFFEIMAIEKNNYDFLKEFSLPMVIHSQHGGFKINIADKNKVKENLSSINFAIKIANQVKSKKIILHPGDLENSNCSYEQAIEFVNNIKDKRILIENIPIQDKMKRFCETPDETIEYLKLTNRELIFDINHAIQVAIAKNIDYREIIKEFVKLKPRHYHLGGQIIRGNENITHKTLSVCNFDLKEIIALLPKNAEITLETEPDIKKTEDDIRIMKQIIKELKY